MGSCPTAVISIETYSFCVSVARRPAGVRLMLIGKFGVGQSAPDTLSCPNGKSTERNVDKP